MRTTVDLPKELLQRALEISGAKTKRQAICWALEQSTRRKALEDLRALRGKIEFSVTPVELEAREIRGQRRRKQLLGGGR